MEPFVRSWSVRKAANTCCIWGGGGSRRASWQFISNIGETIASRSR
jgi:hypothetical protein